MIGPVTWGEGMSPYWQRERWSARDNRERTDVSASCWRPCWLSGREGKKRSNRGDV